MDPRALSTSSRRLLDIVDASSMPVDASELSRLTGRHVTTVRFHLSGLLEQGLITSHSQRTGATGRPRTVYTAAPRPDVGYRQLAGLLAANLGATSASRQRRADRIGRRWAAGSVVEPTSPVDVGDAAGRMVDLFTELHFDPEPVRPVPGGSGHQIRLRSCPYLELARVQPDVVCSIHLGLMRGFLEALDLPDTRATLHPFVEPRLCIAELTTPGTTETAPQQ